jgi:hypothetical protein
VCKGTNTAAASMCVRNLHGQRYTYLLHICACTCEIVLAQTVQDTIPRAFMQALCKEWLIHSSGNQLCSSWPFHKAAHRHRQRDSSQQH